MKKAYQLLVATTLILSVSFTSCKKDDDKKEETNTADPQLTALKVEVAKDYSSLVFKTYTDCLAKGQALKMAIDNFADNPTANGLETAKQAWKEARLTYGQSEAFRLYGGPIDDEDGPEGALNAWPLDESYIDYVTGNENAGIINNETLYPTITGDLLLSLNEEGSETNIATGYHAIEFLLWGQDLSETGPGNRPYTDYLTTGGTAKNQARRAQYLKVVASLLIDDLQYLVDAWAPGSDYRTSFTKESTIDASIGKMFRGIGALAKGELAGERMTVALNNKDQEDEHSCFSDNTHVDIQENFMGIQNVYTNKYVSYDGTTVDGKGLNDLVTYVDAAKNTAVMNMLAQTNTAVFAIEAPFDQAIKTDPGKKIETAINDLKSLSDKMVDAAFKLGITLNTNLD
jgi:putative iron-regulated protein